MSAPQQTSAPSNDNWRADAPVIFWVALAHGASHFGHLLLIPLFPFLMDDFSLSFAQVGLLTSVFFMVSATGQAASGFLVDRVGAFGVLLGALSLFFCAAVVGALAQGYGMLMLTAVLAGLANSPFHPVDFSILNQRVHPDRLGIAYSMHGLAGNLGWALSPALLVSIAVTSHWSTALWVAAGLYALLLLGISQQKHRLTTERLSNHTQDTPPASTREILHQPVVWLCFTFFLLSSMTLAVIQNYSPVIMQRLYQIELTTGAYALSGFMLMAALGALLGGFFTRARAGRTEFILIRALGTGALLLAAVSQVWLAPMWALAALVFTGFVTGFSGPSRDMMIRNATPKGATGRVYGLVYCGLDAGMMLSALLFGFSMDHQWYQQTLLGAAITLALAVLTVTVVQQRSLPKQAAITP